MSCVLEMYWNNFYKIKKKTIMYLYLIFIAIPMAKGAVPGTFFWKPRLGLDLSIPTTEFTMKVSQPNRENIQDGVVVLMEGYNAGMTVISLAAGGSSAQSEPHFNPMSGFFYTNVYRWALRYISLIPYWMGGSGGHYCETHKVWRRRYYYMDEFIPSWLKSALFWVDKQDWEKEELDFKRFKKFAEPAFEFRTRLAAEWKLSKRQTGTTPIFYPTKALQLFGITSLEEAICFDYKMNTMYQKCDTQKGLLELVTLSSE